MKLTGNISPMKRYCRAAGEVAATPRRPGLKATPPSPGFAAPSSFPQATRRRFYPQSAFTLVEIALSIAIIGFALVAIIGVLPAGLNVQKENREETIIVHEANYFIDAIRSGARGLDDLTNYVESITNISVIFNPPNTFITNIFGYTYTGTAINNGPGNPADVLTNGQNIVGLLGTPRFLFDGKPFLPPQNPIPQGFVSSYIVAYIRALSGPAVEKVPQNNASVRDLSFRYRLICELSPYANWNTNWVDFNEVGLAPEAAIARSNYWRIARSLQGNMSELRLVFRWPIDSKRVAGNQRQVFRTLVGGALTNELNLDKTASPRWFLQSSTYQTPL
jgi:type II secretory pathway pseudopilin PulG